MALQTSGPISLLQIQTEFGGTSPISLSEYYGITSGIPGSGIISASNFYGKPAAYTGPFATLNPNAPGVVANATPTGPAGTLTDGNLGMPFVSTNYYYGFDSTVTMTTGKWYFECRVTAAGGSGGGGSGMLIYVSNRVYIAGRGFENDPLGTVASVAFDVDAGTASTSTNGVVTQTTTFTPGSLVTVNGTIGSCPSFIFNFGASPFIYAPPAGYSGIHP